MKAMMRKLSNWEIAKLAFFLFVVFGSLSVFTLTPNLFPSALASSLLFFIFAPLIDALERKGVPRTTGIFGLFLVCGLAITAAATTVTPRISLEILTFKEDSSHYGSTMTERLRAQEAQLLGSFPLFKGLHLADKLVDWIHHSIEKFWAIMPNLASQMLVGLLLVPFFTFILLNDAHEIRRSLLKLVPNRHFETVYSLMSRIVDEMGGYVSARIIEAALVTVLVTAGCLVLKIPYAILLGFFAGATNAIPYLGPLLGAIPGVLIAVIQPEMPNQLFWISLVYAVANVIDMVVIFPLVVAKIVDLHPVAVVISVVLGSQLFGIVGMIVAVPITSIVKILIQEVYSKVYNGADAIR